MWVLANGFYQMIKKGVTEFLEVVGQHDMLMPTKRRRLILLISFVALGTLAPYGFSSFVEYRQATLVVAALALLAGASTLWSP